MHRDDKPISGAEDYPGGIENRISDPPKPPPAPPSLPGLRPLTEASIDKEFGSGERCALLENGAPLLVATREGALVDDQGSLVHLQSEAESRPSLVEGGQFKAGDLVIEVRAGSVRARRGKLFERDTDVRIVRGKRGFLVHHGPPWVCSS